jgi:hypothetical protein
MITKDPQLIRGFLYVIMVREGAPGGWAALARHDHEDFCALWRRRRVAGEVARTGRAPGRPLFAVI